MVYVIIGVLSILLVFVLAITISGTKRVAKTKKLQKSADLSFRKTNGTHNFNYAIKKFGYDSGKRIKIIIVAETNMSDVTYAFKTANVCTANKGRVVLKGVVSGKESSFEYTLTTLEPTITVNIPPELTNEKLHVQVTTEWTFSNNPLVEELEFDLD